MKIRWVGHGVSDEAIQARVLDHDQYAQQRPQVRRNAGGCVLYVW